MKIPLIHRAIWPIAGLNRPLTKTFRKHFLARYLQTVISIFQVLARTVLSLSHIGTLSFRYTLDSCAISASIDFASETQGKSFI